MRRLLGALLCAGKVALLVAFAPVVVVMLLAAQPEDPEDTYHHQL